MMAPVLLNVADAFSMSYITMGVMAVLNLTIGGITPPMAPSLFVSAKVADLPFEKDIEAHLSHACSSCGRTIDGDLY